MARGIQLCPSATLVLPLRIIIDKGLLSTKSSKAFPKATLYCLPLNFHLKLAGASPRRNALLAQITHGYDGVVVHV